MYLIIKDGELINVFNDDDEERADAKLEELNEEADEADEAYVFHVWDYEFETAGTITTDRDDNVTYEEAFNMLWETEDSDESFEDNKYLADIEELIDNDDSPEEADEDDDDEEILNFGDTETNNDEDGFFGEEDINYNGNKL